MTESVTPHPREHLVDPETGETPPLSPPRVLVNQYVEWFEYEGELSAHLESDDAA